MASLQDYLREIGGTQDVRAESLLRNLAAYSANLEAGKALGVPETGKPKRGLGTKILSTL